MPIIGSSHKRVVLRLLQKVGINNRDNPTFRATQGEYLQISVVFYHVVVESQIEQYNDLGGL